MWSLVVELAYLSRPLHKLAIEDIMCIPVKCDSQVAIYIVKNLYSMNEPRT